MSSVFGKKGDAVSKSWSDLWDEDEEEEAERERQELLQQRREHNARSWSQESNDDDHTSRNRGLGEAKTCAIVNNRTPSPRARRPSNTHGFGFDGVDENDGFFFQGPHPPRYSPNRHPSRKVIIDKWAALGDRRRAYHPENKENGKPTQPVKFCAKKDFGLGFHDSGGWDKHARPRIQRKEDFEDLEWVGGWHDPHL